MKSISGKILRATLYWLVVIVVLMTFVSMLVVSKITKTDSKLLITQICDKETIRFNDQFRFLENSVKTVLKYVQNLESESVSEEELLSDECCEKIQNITLSIANHTDGAMAVYFRYNPELTGNGTQGFFWSRNSDTDTFSYFAPTDILQYNPDDTERVGWFYEPKKKREPMWMTPYYNKNLNVFMISYIIPYYTRSGKFLGVIGMDIDFNKIIYLTSEVSIYESGKMDLIDFPSNLIYSSEKNKSVIRKMVPDSLREYIIAINKNSAAEVLYNEEGEKFLTCITHLQNGMKLMLYVPMAEVNELRNDLLITFSILMIISVAITVFLIVRLTNQMVQPLKKLTRVTEKYAVGDWSDSFICKTDDEIQELSESIYVMAGITKSYIEKINESAMTDSLTELKNKNCYLSFIEKFNKNLNPEKDKYGVLVFDLNYLKKINDQFGHEAGDKLIKAAAVYICGIFTHSPVFRIGGDEFNVILGKRDYLERENLCCKFESDMKKLPPVAGDVSLSIAYGIACYPEDGSTYDEVFKKADERMYENKKAMKAGRE